MLLVSSAAAAMQRSRQVHVNGRDYTLAEYVGAAPKHGVYVHGNEVNDNGLPQGFQPQQKQFLVQVAPGAEASVQFKLVPKTKTMKMLAPLAEVK